jgi:hypothetical protein
MLYSHLKEPCKTEMNDRVCVGEIPDFILTCRGVLSVQIKILPFEKHLE